MRIKNFYLFLLVLVAGLAASISRAHALELTYPSLPFGGLSDTTNSLAQVFQFFFAAALWLAGIALLTAIIFIGFQYMTSGANPGKQKGARQRLAGVALGGAALFGVFIILSTINPQLISTRNLTFGICGGAGLPDCPTLELPTFGAGGAPQTCPPNCPPPPPQTCPPNCPPPIPTGSFVYYCQGNTQWRDMPYIGTGTTIGGAGCGATSLAMVLSSFGASCNGQTCMPSIVANMISDGMPGVSVAGYGTSFPSPSAAVASFGLTANFIGLSSGAPNFTLLKRYLDGGALVIGGASDFPCPNLATSAGHGPCSHLFVVDRVVDPAQHTIEVRDPDNCSYTDGNDEGDASFSPNPGRASILNADSFHWVIAFAVSRP